MKRLFVLLVCAALLGCFTAGCDGNTIGPIDGTTTAPTVGSASVADPIGSRQLGSKILQQMENWEYPAYYGGCYIDADNSVIILVTDAEISMD